MPRVSVIIPSYNHGLYIADAINSVLNQTFQDFEIIITDDCSTDDTVKVIQEFTDPRIKLFCFSQNQGTAFTTNHCIENCQGEFIAPLNSDDFFHINKLEKQVNFLDHHPNYGAVFSLVKFIGEKGNLLNKVSNYPKFNDKNKTKFVWLNNFFHNGNSLCHPSVLIRKKCHDDLGLYDPRLAQLLDLDLWIRVCSNYDIFIIPEQLLFFRLRDNKANMSAHKPESKYRTSVEYSIVLKRFLTPIIFENIDQIFPEVNNLNLASYLQSDLDLFGRFIIAKLALNSSIKSVNYFGLNLLYQLMENEEKATKLIDSGFNYKELINLSGRSSIFDYRQLNDDNVSISSLVRYIKQKLSIHFRV